MRSHVTAKLKDRDLLGHPVGLFVLFFTEMWERFSYYGMRALLVLYGCFKPNISTQVGDLYKTGDPRRDGAFTSSTWG